MSVLSELGFGRDDKRGMLIDPPDHVLAEAGSLKPRPSVASGVMTAEPAALAAWWPTRGRIDAAGVSRLHWMASAANGEAWLVCDPDDEDCADDGEIRQAVTDAGIAVADQLTLSSGEIALQLRSL